MTGPSQASIAEVVGEGFQTALEYWRKYAEENIIAPILLPEEWAAYQEGLKAKKEATSETVDY